MNKLLSILCIVSIISSMTIVPTFAEELDKISINIKENTQNGEKELKEEIFQVSDLEIDGFEKSFDEENNVYIFTQDTEELISTISDENDITICDDTEIEFDSIVEDIQENLEISINENEQELFDKSNDDNVTTFAVSTQADLAVSDLTPINELIGGGKATFNFKISNLGKTNANSVEVGIKVDNSLIGIINLGTIEASHIYISKFSFDGASAGSHTVEVIADVNNKIAESDKANNSTKGTFIWKQNTTLPDLSVEILSPTSGKSIYGATDDDDTTNVKFKILNNGGEMPNSNFLCTILVNNQTIQRFYVSPISANSSATGSFNIALKAWGEIELGIEADSLKEITELNENNNLGTAIYNIIYCTHYLEEKIGKNAQLKVRVESSAKNNILNNDFYKNNLGVWNSIVDDCAITNVYYSDERIPDENIIIYGTDFIPAEGYTDDVTVLGRGAGNGKNGFIKLAVPALSAVKEQQRERTLRHELGHVFGLAHPINDENEYSSHKYHALMFQSTFEPNITEPTPHDCYNFSQQYSD